MPAEPPKRPQKALWRRSFDTAERAVGGRVEPTVQRREFAVGLEVVKRVDLKARGIVGGVTGRVLHALGIPTVGDVRRLHEHLNAVDAHLSEVVREHDQPSQAVFAAGAGDARVATPTDRDPHA